MIVGYDKGATATKIAAVEGEHIIFAERAARHCKSDIEILKKMLKNQGFSLSSVTDIAITGVGTESVDFGDIDAKIHQIPELEATGIGGSYIGHHKECIVISIGTGTSMVLMKDGEYKHIGGTGVGCGTLKGLGKKIFNNDSLAELYKMAEKGDRCNVDTLIKDLFSGTDTLPQDLTASNLSKYSDKATDNDWVAGILNMVLEVVGTHAVIAANGYGVDTVVLTGGITKTEFAERVYQNFSDLYPQTFIIPTYSDIATAIGAARRVMLWNQEKPLCKMCQG